MPAFKIDTLPVTNGEFLEFVTCGAYEDERYWRPADWQWKELESKRIRTLVKTNRQWLYRAMFDICRWSKWHTGRYTSAWPKLARLRGGAANDYRRKPNFTAPPSPAQWNENTYPWGESARVRATATSISPLVAHPVGSHPAGASRWGVGELVGNGWELTDTPFAPFPGFTPYMTTYPDYSKDFFDGKHFVVKGASWATATVLIRPSFRKCQQAHYSYVFAKFRCASSYALISRGKDFMKATWEDTIIAESDKTVVIEGNHYFPPDSIKRE